MAFSAVSGRRRGSVIVAVSALVAAGVTVIAGVSSGAAHAAGSGSGDWSPPTSVNRTPTGSIPTGAWSQTPLPSSGGVTANATSPAAAAGAGVLKYYQYETFGLDTIGGLQAQVNVGDGNLVVHSTDLKINGPGLNLKLDRFFNSKAANQGAFGSRSVLSTGADVGLNIGASSVQFSGPSGFLVTFTGTGPTYTSPAGINADLVKNADATFSLTYHSSGEKLTFSTGGYLTSDADKNGNTISLGYNGDNTLASITDTAGRVTTFHYSGGFISSYTDPASRQETYSYDGAQNLHQTQDPVNGLVTYTWDSNHRITRIQTAQGTYTDFTYDNSSGKVLTVKRYLVAGSLTSGSRTWTFTYPSATQTTEQDPAGHTTTYTIDSSQRVTATTNPLGKTKSKTWTPNSDVATATDAMGTGGTGGNVTTFSYDSNNNVTAVATPTGAAARAQYANSTGGSGPACSSADTTHPFLAKCSEDAQTNQTSLAYDTAGNLTSSTDTSTAPNSGVSKTYTYQGDPGVTSCGGKTGQECSSTAGNGNTTTYAYNGNGDLTTVTPPSPGIATSYTYDSLSRVATVTTPKGVLITYAYDKRDEPTKTTYVGGGNIVYSYDADGNLLSRADTVGGTESYTYDGLNRQLTTTTPGAASAVSVTYDSAGNTATYTDPSGTVTYGYDNANELTKLAEPGGSCTGTVNKCTTFGYDANGNLLTTTYPGGTVQTSTRDNSGRATEIKTVHSSTVLSDLAYSYTTGTSTDTALVQTRTDKLGVGGPLNSVITYGYDTLDRVTAATEKTSGGTTNASWAYGYDKDGNRTSNSNTISGTTTTTAQGYNAIDQLTSLNGVTTGLSYDNDGNETANPGSTTPSSPARTSETYNARDQLTSMVASGSTRTSTYLGEDQTDLLTAGPTTYQNALLGLSSATTSGTTTSYVRTPGGTLIAAKNGTTAYYYLTDNIGSIVGMVDTSGNAVAAYSYDPYGRQRSSNGSYATANPFHYAAGLYNPATGLTKFGARYYDPITGRFTQTDPSGQENNPYAYAGNNPIGLADPTGLSFFDFATRVVGAASGAISGGLAGQALGYTALGALAVAGIAGPDEVVLGSILVGSVAGSAYGAAGGPYIGL